MSTGRIPTGNQLRALPESVLDERFARAPPVRPKDFSAWCAEATNLRGLLVRESAQAAEAFAALAAQPADVDMDDLGAEAPRDLVVRRTLEEAELVLHEGTAGQGAQMPQVRAALTGLSDTGTAAPELLFDELPVNHGLDLAATELRCVQAAIRDRAELKRNPRGKDSTWVVQPLPEGPAAEAEPRLGPSDAVLRVALFSSTGPQKLLEVLATGRTTLAELRGELTCSHEALAKDVAARRGREGLLPSRSAAFFIGGRFYVDLAGGDDITAGLRSAIASAPELQEAYPHAPSAPADASEVQLGDLELELGAQYLFVHLGQCEHPLVFTEMRAFAPETDVPGAGAYPFVALRHKPVRRNCGVCKQHPAARVVMGDPSYLERTLIDSPAYFCDSCYQDLHYGPDGNLLHNDFRVFSVFPGS
mmetsp:Transcript_25686/g.86138  ORF Transcript_25686/g.86138 Transcript_25686/m.86138 type:complete len:419 (+) Transcript_25686:59-1315(+)